MTRFYCERALIDGQIRANVQITVDDGRFASIDTDVPPHSDSTSLSGVTIPGLANTHSHAFHRALRSRTQADRGSFWTWRELMYRAAERLNPDNYFDLARATFAEMVGAGITTVGEFHYVHHQPDGTQYDDPNAMGRALMAAADEAGLRITVLDAAYLHGGLNSAGYEPVGCAQARFADEGATGWLDRVSSFGGQPRARVGAAIHSVRAVDPDAVMAIADWVVGEGVPLHAHVSEQRAENEQCSEAHGRTPVQVLGDAGALTDRFSAVHATHLTSRDIDTLARAGSTVSMCPTTERDLGDGIGPATDFRSAGIPITLGSDSHAVIDHFEEARLVELHERLRTERRGIHPAEDLLAMATDGHRSLGWDDAGSITVGGRADLVAVDADSVRLAGIDDDSVIESLVFAATADDVTDVVIDGEHVVRDRRHVRMEVSSELRGAIASIMEG